MFPSDPESECDSEPEWDPDPNLLPIKLWAQSGLVPNWFIIPIRHGFQVRAKLKLSLIRSDPIESPIRMLSPIEWSRPRKNWYSRFLNLYRYKSKYKNSTKFYENYINMIGILSAPTLILHILPDNNSQLINLIKIEKTKNSNLYDSGNSDIQNWHLKSAN